MTVIIIIGIIIGFFWLVKKIGTTNSYNQTNYNSYRNRNTSQDDYIKELFEDLTLQQRRIFMIIYISVLQYDSTQKIRNNADAGFITDRAVRLLRVTVEETVRYVKMLDHEKFQSILSLVQNKTLTDYLLTDYIMLIQCIEKMEDQIKALGLIVDVYAMMGYTEKDIKDVMEKMNVLMKEFYSR